MTLILETNPLTSVLESKGATVELLNGLNSIGFRDSDILAMAAAFHARPLRDKVAFWWTPGLGCITNAQSQAVTCQTTAGSPPTPSHSARPPRISTTTPITTTRATPTSTASTSPTTSTTSASDKTRSSNARSSVSNVSAVTNGSESVVIALRGSDPAPKDSLTYSIVSGPFGGTFSAITGASVMYTPRQNSVITTDSFTYKATDSAGLSSNTGTVTIEVNVAGASPESS